MQCVLEAALALEDVTIAAEVVRLLAPYAGRAVINAGALMFHGVTDDTLGRAAALLGRPAEAERLCSAAIATYERIGAGWWRDRLRDASPLPPLAPAPSITTLHLHRQPGGLWLVGRAGHEFSLADLRGLHHLHTLVAHPDTPIDVLVLVGSNGHAAPAETGLELLDDQARRAYRSRLVQLEQEIDEAESDADLGRRDRLSEEREALLEQLRGATGSAVAAEPVVPARTAPESPSARRSSPPSPASPRATPGSADTSATASTPVWNAATRPTQTDPSVGS